MKYFKFKKENEFKKAFTLVETLVAISILSLSILGTFTAVQGGLQKSMYTKEQTTAFYLAQEAMEYIRNIRDQNAIKSINSISSGGGYTDWLTGLSANSSDPCYFGNVCAIDSPSNSVFFCGTTAGSCPVLKQDTQTSLFGYNFSWTDTHFKREITLQNVKAGKEFMATVNVSWDGKSFIVSQLFTNNR